jgi:hypothetical protein
MNSTNPLPCDLQLERNGAVAVRVLWQPPTICQSSCCCCCHHIRHGQTPRFLQNVLGVLFWSYVGLAVLRPPCDLVTCRRSEQVSLHLCYYFPTRWLQSMISLTCEALPLGGPQVSMKTMRLVDNNAAIFHLTQLGDIDGIKNLFIRGLASPLDVGHSGGRTPLHVRGKHSSHVQ